MRYTVRQLEDLARQRDRGHTAFADGMAAAYRHIADETENEESRMTHATYHANDAEIRVFPAEEPYDRSDMYVMEVLDTTVTVYLKQGDPADDTSGSRLQIMIEAPAPFTIDINGDSNDYGDEA